MTLPTCQDILALAAELAQKFAASAARHDAERTFPHENYAELRASGYPRLTVPTTLGGWGAGMFDAVLAQETLAMGDGSTALSITMHVQTVGAAASGEKWDAGVFERLCREVVMRGALVNSCASEPDMGSPSRGGRPATTARRSGSQWIINGRKSFASMSPELDYFIIPAAIEGEDEIVRFLVLRQPGIEIADTWDSMGMRTTGSHDILLHDVCVDDDLIISRAPVSMPDPSRLNLNVWFTLTVSAVYLGIAAAAQQAALHYARTRVPTALGRPIATLDSIQRRLGEAEFLLQQSRSVLYRVADRWDREPEQREALQQEALVAKLTVTNNAISVVDHAMRAVGGASVTKDLPLERYYRDVRAGLHHPPFDDTAIPLLGRIAVNRLDSGGA